jgi:acyl-CoA synthetase (AMP-forming)/AMP-acid ligase II
LENIAGIYSPLLSGGSINVLSEHHRGLSGSSGMNLPALLTAITESQANSMILFPQIVSLLILAILQGWKVPKSFQFMAVGGAKVSADLMASAKALGLPVYRGYGLSECASVVALSNKSTALEAVGEVLPHLQVSIEKGEILISLSVALAETFRLNRSKVNFVPSRF